MNSRSLLVGGLALALVVTAVALLWPATEPPSETAPEAATAPAPAPRPSAPSRPAAVAVEPEVEPAGLPPDATLEEAEAAVATARVEREQARAAFLDAEAELDELEVEIERVEEFVEELVARGEDPADHAFEGMERLNPIIEEFEAKMSVLEEAEMRDAEAQRALKEAQRQLDTLRRASP